MVAIFHPKIIYLSVKSTKEQQIEANVILFSHQFDQLTSSLWATKKRPIQLTNECHTLISKLVYLI